MFSVSLQCLQVVEIVRPSGDELRANDPGVEYHQFQAGRIVTLPNPTPGAWTVRVAGKGMFFLVLQAKTELTLDRVAFVEPGGRPGHEGLFPIKGAPKRGAAQKLEVEMSGAFRNPRFRFVSSAAELIQDAAARAARGQQRREIVPRRCHASGPAIPARRHRRGRPRFSVPAGARPAVYG